MSMSRHDDVKNLRIINPALPAAEIARQLHISRERVRKILLDLGLPTRVMRATEYTDKTSARYPINLSHSNIGAIAEYIVSIDLAVQGFDVYRSILPHAPCDLLILYKNTPFRVEVKAAKRNKSTNNLSFSRGKSINYDIIAAVDQDHKIQYYPPQIIDKILLTNN